MPNESAIISKLYSPEVSFKGTSIVNVTNFDVGLGGCDANSKLEASNCLSKWLNPKEDKVTVSTPLPLFVKEMTK